MLLPIFKTYTPPHATLSKTSDPQCLYKTCWVSTKNPNYHYKHIYPLF